ncbi:MAG: hypothetical protein V2A74_14365, partial [bacterium]
ILSWENTTESGRNVPKIVPILEDSFKRPFRDRVGRGEEFQKRLESFGGMGSVKDSIRANASRLLEGFGCR